MTLLYNQRILVLMLTSHTTKEYLVVVIIEVPLTLVKNIKI